MIYRNPVVSGFYPDPSVCKANGRFYMVCSSFQFFPGVPLFESDDLLNWKQIGNVLTRDSQLPLEGAAISGGIYAPTIRYEAGRFYMVVTNVSSTGNFYVYTDDINAEWSEPIKVDQGGIDPSPYFEEGRAYFVSNGNDPEKGGIPGIQMCEIDIKTGEKLTESRYIWHGSGGRFVEAPHIYKIGDRYILMTAEGGTEYGHMVTYAVSDSLWGEYRGYKKNPVLSNRNLGGYPVQGVGHADLIEDNNGHYWLLHLGFRQQDEYKNYHHLGRETFLTPVTFGADGFFTAGATKDMTGTGTVKLTVETDRFPENTKQEFRSRYSLDNIKHEWLYVRNPIREHYEFAEKKITLHGTGTTLVDKNPTFVGIRQTGFSAKIGVRVKLLREGSAGLTIYMDEDHHYDVHAVRTPKGVVVMSLQTVGNIKTRLMKYTFTPDTDEAILWIVADRFNYEMFGNADELGTAPAKYLSTEVAGGFTGVLIGVYAEDTDAQFFGFGVSYDKD
jgi:alpha-N-arabinofuranosidase